MPVTMFGWRDRPAGLRRGRCSDCVAGVKRTWYESRRRLHREENRLARRRRYEVNSAIIAAAKDVPCTDCGKRFAPEQLDFDHVSGQKSFNIGASRHQVSESRLRAEIAKCEVVCAVCHRIRTHDRSAR